MIFGSDSIIRTPDINHAVYIQVYGFIGNAAKPTWCTVQSLFERDDQTWDDLVTIAQGRAVEFRNYHKQVRVVEFKRSVSVMETVIDRK